jgi:hypothetical protein
MPFKFEVTMPDGTFYKVTRLLAPGKSNTKTLKSDLFSDEYITYSLSLAPAKSSGFNLCPSASKHCIESCIFTSGLAGVFPRTIQPARIAKARMLRMNKDVFIDRLMTELLSAQRLASRKGRKLAVRLNVFSDVMWEREFPSIFTTFPNIQFYEYTKIYNRMVRFTLGQLPPNYHLTFSWSGKNKEQCEDILSRWANVAVPFHVKRSKPLPSTFLGRPVLDGDLTDLRFLDTIDIVDKSQHGCIIGLRAKGKGRKDASGFVVSV